MLGRHKRINSERTHNYTSLLKGGHFVSRSEYIRIFLLRTLGNFLLISSLYIIALVFYRPVTEEVRYTFNRMINKHYILAEDARFTIDNGIREKGLLAQALNIETLEVLVPKDPEFSIIIPKLGANENVVADVNTAHEDEYLAALKTGVAHAEGSKKPGENGHVYLFAHSTNTFSNVSRYNAIFYLLYKLEEGDEINVYYKGVRHKYKVIGKKIVDPSEVEYLTKKTDKEFLTLQTCWPPGTIAKRLIVFAQP